MNESSASLFLVLFLSADVVFNVFHIIKHTPFANSLITNVRISSYLEIYHLVKLFWIVILFVYLLKLTKYSGYVSWILIFSFFLFDDAFFIHQNLGAYLANNSFTLFPGNLPSQSRIYELVVLAISGILLSSILFRVYLRSTPIFRKISHDMLMFIMALIFFGLMIDIASIFNPLPAIRISLEIIEDAGEMVVFSLIIWYVFLLAIREGKPNLFLHELISTKRTKAS
jgi:hypothetical protein